MFFSQLTLNADLRNVNKLLTALIWKISALIVTITINVRVASQIFGGSRRQRVLTKSKQKYPKRKFHQLPHVSVASLVAHFKQDAPWGHTLHHIGSSLANVDTRLFQKSRRKYTHSHMCPMYTRLLQHPTEMRHRYIQSASRRQSIDREDCLAPIAFPSSAGAVPACLAWPTEMRLGVPSKEKNTTGLRGLCWTGGRRQLKRVTFG